MKLEREDEYKRIVKAAREGWEERRRDLLARARNDLVAVDWNVEYEPLGHDILIIGTVKVLEVNDFLLQVWLKDMHPGIWIPEFRPWVASVSEYEPAQRIRSARVGLFDSKWRKEDEGETYYALFWGYFDHGGAIESFALEKKFVYPVSTDEDAAS